MQYCLDLLVFWFFIELVSYMDICDWPCALKLLKSELSSPPITAVLKYQSSHQRSMYLHYYRARKSMKSSCACTISFLNELRHNAKKNRFIYEGLVTILLNSLSRYQQKFNTLKGFKICDCISLINKRPLMLHIF